jgi:hypothetical protein
MPEGQDPPPKPANYAALIWAAPIPAVADVEGQVRAIMERKPKDRTVQIARQIGWLYNDYQPSPELTRSQQSLAS